jgi:hypothetical protein
MRFSTAVTDTRSCNMTKLPRERSKAIAIQILARRSMTCHQNF